MENNPYTKYRFRVATDGIDVAGSSEVTGFEAGIEAVEYSEGNMLSPKPIKLPSLRKYGNITLKWGLTVSMDMYNWMCPSFNSDVERKTVTIILQNENNKDVASWELLNAWPAKYAAPEFDASASEIAIELLELAHEGMTRTK